MISKKIKDKQLLPDNDLIALLKKMVKQSNDSCEAYKKAGRKELLDNEMSEIKIINEFLPKQLSEEEMNKICVEKIKQGWSNTIKDMGKVVGALKKDYSDVMDFSKASQIIKRKFKMSMKYPKNYLEEIKFRLKVSQIVGKSVLKKKR